MKSIKDLKLESLNIPKFAAERIDPENVSELSDDELVRLGVTTIGDHDPHRLRVLCANAEKKKHQSMAAAALSERMALFSGRSNFRLFS